MFRHPPIQAGTTYTAGDGITLTSDIVTNTLIGGLAGGQTIKGGTASAEDLTLQSTNHATKGHIYFGTLGAYDQANNRLGIGTAAPATPLHAEVTTGDLRFIAVANHGGASQVTYEATTSGVAGSNAAMRFYSGGAGSEWNVGLQHSTLRMSFGFGGSVPSVSTLLQTFSQNTVVSDAAATLDRILFPSTTVTISGTTQVTTAAGLNYLTINRPTYTDASAVTVDRGATVYIENAPLAAGSVTLTKPYSLFVDAGLSRFDGNGTHVFELPADATGNATAATGRIPVSIGGATVYIRYYAD